MQYARKKAAFLWYMVISRGFSVDDTLEIEFLEE